MARNRDVYWLSDAEWGTIPPHLPRGRRGARQMRLDRGAGSRVAGERVQSSHLYADYVGWCGQRMVRHVRQKGFSMALADFRSRKSSGVYFLDIGLRQTGFAIAA